MYKGHETKEQYIRPSLVKTDYSYQRVVPEREIKAILAHWNYDLVNMPKVSQRIDGSYYVVDGQHTLAAWKIHENDAPIKCKVYLGLSYEEEVELFLQQFGVAKPVNIFQKMNARFNRGDVEVVELVNAAKAGGVEISFKAAHAPNKTNAWAACQRGYKKLGAWHFTNAISILRDAWDGDPNGLKASFIDGIVELYDSNSGQFDRARLVETLGKNKPTFYVRNANEHVGTMGKRYAAVFREVYNKNKTTRRLVPPAV